jgi:hypothetical protein
VEQKGIILQYRIGGHITYKHIRSLLETIPDIHRFHYQKYCLKFLFTFVNLRKRFENLKMISEIKVLHYQDSNPVRYIIDTALTQRFKPLRHCGIFIPG